MAAGSSALIVHDNVGTDGTDTLVNIQRLKFADSVVAVDINGNAGQAYRLYQAAFHRTPDTPGLSYWTNSLDHGMDLTSVAANFTASSEFKSVFGDPATLSTSKYLDMLYLNILGRAPDAAGKAYWADQIDGHGFGRDSTLALFSESAENKVLVGVAIAHGITLDPIWLT